METKTRPKRTSKRRRDILDASLRCFMEHGIEAATIEQIREASGASSGSIYHHFGSKQAIAIALYLEGMEELATVFRQAMSREDDLRLGIQRILKSYFRWVGDHREWALYLLRVATADTPAEDGATIDEINRRTRDDLSNWLKPFAERGEILELPNELYASILFGPATHYARHWLVGRLTLDLNTVARHLAEVTWRALCIPDESSVSRSSSSSRQPALTRTSSNAPATTSRGRKEPR